METPVQGAKFMALRGMHVFPLQPGKKTPFKGESFIRLATRDFNQIDTYAAKHPDCNWGVLATGSVILDVDTKNGVEALESLMSLGSLPKTFKVRTPTGGWHIYFMGFDARNNQLGPSLDVRSRNAYVVAPGSKINGHTYEVIIDAAFAPVPENVRNKLGKAYTSSASGQIAGEHIDTDVNLATATAYATAAQSALQGERERALFKLACELKDLGVSDSIALGIVVEHWNPRCEPPLNEGELERVVASAYRNGVEPIGINAPSANFEVLDGEAIDAGIEAARKKAREKLTSLELGAWNMKTAPKVERHEWLADHLLQRGHLTNLVAPGGVGKSVLTISWAVALARGNGDFLGINVPDRARVLLVNNEDDAKEQDRRLTAQCQHHDIDMPNMQGWLHRRVSPRSFVALKQGEKRGTFVESVEAKIIRDYCRANKIDVIIFDPFVEMHHGNENDNSEMATVMQWFRDLAHELDVAIVLVHHTRKLQEADATGHQGNMDTGRGASALVNGARLAFTLFRMTKKEGKARGVPEGQNGSERMRHIRLDRSKGNYTAPGPNTQWMRLASVTIPNGDDAPALELANVDTEEMRTLKHYCECLVDALVDAGEDGITLYKAAQLALASPMIEEKMSEPTTRRRVKEHFENPVPFREYTIELVNGKLLATC